MIDVLYVVITLAIFGSCYLLVIGFDKLMEHKK